MDARSSSAASMKAASPMSVDATAVRQQRRIITA
jgi:hypothetical protein